MSFQIQFQDVPHDDAIRDECERLVSALREEFPETTRFEVIIKQDGAGHETHVHATGKDLDRAAHGKGEAPRDSVQDAFERMRRQLRKHHDKQIFAKRRAANRKS